MFVVNTLMRTGRLPDAEDGFLDPNGQPCGHPKGSVGHLRSEVAVMGRTIVMCSDGTGNTFDARITNVSRMVRFLDASDAGRQVIRYDPGVGTVAARTEHVRSEGAADGEAVEILPTANRSQRGPVAWLDRTRGLAFGYGLKENVFQLYAELAALYLGPEDRLFLFGFSRGAFTVRALAGLLHRCHLPAVAGGGKLRERFERAWTLFTVMRPDAVDVEAIRRGQRCCPVHFLGVWDTVKSYGGLTPVVLPHLRHNPDVSHVRHALAMDERRAWFKPTTWGGLDSDEHGAMTRLTERDAAACRSQDVVEVWFTGCHGDIGAGDIAMRWMLGEAVAVSPGIRLTDEGLRFLGLPDPAPKVHQSWNRRWRAVEQLPRLEIDNSGVWPVRRPHRGSDGYRNPGAAQRGDRILLHATVRRSAMPPIAATASPTVRPNPTVPS
jgi:uncharacterized protein (DUF2235 family)